MNRNWKGYAAGFLTAALLFGTAGTALAAYQKQATLDYTGIKITLDGKAVTPTDASGNTVEPFAIDGATYLPVRGIASALGLSVGWDQTTQTVQLTSQGAGQTPAPTPSTAPAATGYSRKNPAPVGTAQSIRVESYLGDYSVSALVVESARGDAAWEQIKAANIFNSLPNDGMEYVLVKLRLSLDSVEKDQSVSFSSYSFTPYSKDNAEYSNGVVVPPTPQFSGSLYEGGTLEGYAVYTVSKTDDAPKLVLGADYQGAGGIWFAMTE